MIPSIEIKKRSEDWAAGYEAGVETAHEQPIDMVLHCPKCHVQHIDAAEYELSESMEAWSNPPHRSHLCHTCGHIWRPADVPTNGVAAVQTRGTRDSEIV